MKNSEQWLKLAVKVAQSYGDGTRSPRTNNIDCSIMAQCVKVLLAGRPLSPKQRDSFVESVRTRVGGQYVTREFPPMAMLTARQRQTALKNEGNILTDLIASFPQAFDADALALGAGQSVTRGITVGMSSARDHDVHSSYPIPISHAVSLLPTCGEWSGDVNGVNSLASSTERNTTERNNTERMTEMDLRSTRRSLGLAPRVPVASPADEVALATPPEHPGSPVGSPVVSVLRSAGEVAAHMSFRERMMALGVAPPRRQGNETAVGERPTSSRAYGDLSEAELAELARVAQQELRGHEALDESPKEFTGEIKPGLEVSGRMQIEAALWLKDENLSGEITINGQKFQVNFETYTRCESKMYLDKEYHPAEHAWLSKHMWASVGAPYRRKASGIIGKLERDERFAVSGLYKDWGCKGSPMPRIMARTCWDNGELSALELHNGTGMVLQKMRVNHRRGGKSPDYKHA
ncbi:hypothetical protein [Methylobacterium sp. CM6257]